MSSWDSVPVVDDINRRAFFGDFVTPGRPVVLRGVSSDWKALDWGLERFQQLPGSVKLGVKVGAVADGQRVSMSIAAYADALERYEARIRAGEPGDSPGYLHDVPIFRVFPELADEASPFPLKLFPKWYWQTWQEYAQFFMGPTGSSTPLHFDTLLTHNLFFHLAGRKRFVLIPAEQRTLCYPKSWRWMRYDPIHPDPESFPLAAGVTPVTVDLEAGDTLYLPSGTLHHVTNLSMTIAFNIDWHTSASARDGLASVARGAPWKNGYYNLLSLLGVGLRVPSKVILPLYRSYLTYVS